MRSHVHRGCGRGGNRNAYAARPGWTQGTAPPPAGPGPVGGQVRASPPPGHCSANSVGPAPSRRSEASPRHTGPTACGCIGAIAKTYAARGESPQGHRRLVLCRAGSADPPPHHPQTGAGTPVVCRAIGARLRSTAAGCEPSTASGRTGRLTFGPSPPMARSWFLGAGSDPAPSGCGDARLRACARATGPPAGPTVYPRRVSGRVRDGAPLGAASGRDRRDRMAARALPPAPRGGRATASRDGARMGAAGFVLPQGRAAFTPRRSTDRSRGLRPCAEPPLPRPRRARSAAVGPEPPDPRGRAREFAAVG